jgi:GDP-L-fucose synthase
MKSNEKIFVAGHRGLVGSAIYRRLVSNDFSNVVTRTHSELDLTDQRAVNEFFDRERPAYVFLCAAKVGGILANSTYPAQFIYQNLAIQTNVIHFAWQVGVKRLLFLGSSCIYPRECPQPMREEYLLTGPLESTNRPYAVAKIAGIEMCRSYNEEYGTQFLGVMPTNLYGPGDNYDLQTSHVLPALIRKMHEAKRAGSKEVVVWGTGKPRREFLYSDDMVDACILLMNLADKEFAQICRSIDIPPLINIGCGDDLTIRDLADLVRDVVGFEGAIIWDQTKPDGTPRKLLDSSRIESLGWRPSMSLRDGIARAYQDFLDNR